MSAPVDETDQSPREEPKRRSFLSELPFLLLAALVVAVLIKTFLIQPFYIPSGSMIPTLLVDDRVLVSKVSYLWSDPERGDVIVFENPYAPELDESFPESVVRVTLEALGIRTSASDDLIKRVIGLGGETIEIVGGQLLIDGVPLDEPYLQVGSAMGNFGPRALAPDELFMMGDNRNESSDGRVFGPIPADDVIGKAVLRIWPLSRIGTIDG
ncbi:MAG TPA: signal peptidase I [Acidimicrobiia bacterium]|nr:signal peptidase I [Acidimicrobiia bacterium]